LDTLCGEQRKRQLEDVHDKGLENSGIENERYCTMRTVRSALGARVITSMLSSHKRTAQCDVVGHLHDLDALPIADSIYGFYLKVRTGVCIILSTLGVLLGKRLSPLR
jgi:hypothetical protein